MISNVVVILILLGIIIIGFIKIVYGIGKYKNNYNFVNEYISKLNNLLSEKISNEDYTYILTNTTKLSNTMGMFGIVDYSPPFSNYMYKNYSITNIILNYDDAIMKPELRLVVKTILVYLGACNDKIEKLKKSLKNPLQVFAEGFRVILNTPLFILKSLGLVSDKIYYKIKGNYFYHFIQNIIGLMGFMSAIVTLMQGKEIIFNTYYKLIQDVASIF